MNLTSGSIIHYVNKAQNMGNHYTQDRCIAEASAQEERNGRGTQGKACAEPGWGAEPHTLLEQPPSPHTLCTPTRTLLGYLLLEFSSSIFTYTRSIQPLAIPSPVPLPSLESGVGGVQLKVPTLSSQGGFHQRLARGPNLSRLISINSGVVQRGLLGITKDSPVPQEIPMALSSVPGMLEEGQAHSSYYHFAWLCLSDLLTWKPSAME